MSTNVPIELQARDRARDRARLSLEVSWSLHLVWIRAEQLVRRALEARQYVAPDLDDFLADPEIENLVRGASPTARTVLRVLTRITFVFLRVLAEAMRVLRPMQSSEDEAQPWDPETLGRQVQEILQAETALIADILGGLVRRGQEAESHVTAGLLFDTRLLRERFFQRYLAIIRRETGQEQEQAQALERFMGRLQDTGELPPPRVILPAASSMLLLVTMDHQRSIVGLSAERDAMRAARDQEPDRILPIENRILQLENRILQLEERVQTLRGRATLLDDAARRDAARRDAARPDEQQR